MAEGLGLPIEQITGPLRVGVQGLESRVDH